MEEGQRQNDASQPGELSPRLLREVIQGRSQLPEGGREVIRLIKRRFQGASERLTSKLQGTVLLEVPDGNLKEQVIISPQADAPQVTIRLSMQALLRIAAGDLNPQMALVSDKVTVTGDHGLAMYFFNLVAPFDARR